MTRSVSKFLAGSFILSAACSLSPRAIRAQALGPVERAAVVAATEYHVFPDQIYLRASNTDVKVDVITTAPRAVKRPTLIYIHGGGWYTGSKDASALLILPYLARGMNVVNVEYRMAYVALAPAAVEDCRCALHWVYVHANDFGFDVNRLVVAGHSAGGYLSLTTGMLPASAGFDNQCPDQWQLKVAAIVNYFGITDVADLLHGSDTRVFAQMWFAGLPNADDLAKRISPLNYVRKGVPPFITIHGDKDPVVPYQHAVRLHKALDQAGVPNKLITIAGGGHGDWDRSQNILAQAAIDHFLEDLGIIGRK
jgi:acetyl esterase/lipase